MAAKIARGRGTFGNRGGSMQVAESQVPRYGVDGYVSPLDALTQDQVSTYRHSYEGLEAYLADLIAKTPPAQVTLLSETHAYLPWAHELARNPNVLDAVESVLGPDILIWHSRWFVKYPADETYVSWHQDGTYWALDPPNVTTAWIALSPSNEASGCMKVVPGSQKMGQLQHRDTFEERNALTRGQEIEMEVEEDDAVCLELEPGQFSLHHIGVVHGSGPNRSRNPRIGFAVRYATPEVRQDVEHSFAILVRGEDRYGHFDLLEPPRDGALEECVARGQQIIDRLYANLLPPSSAEA